MSSTPEKPAPAAAATDAAVTLALAEIGPEPTPEAKDLRGHKRTPLKRVAIVTEVLPDFTVGNSWTCRTANLSRSGIAVLSRRMVHQGTMVFVELVGGPGERRLLYGTVVHFRYVKDGEHHLGIKFAALPARRTLHEWMQSRRDD